MQIVKDTTVSLIKVFLKTESISFQNKNPLKSCTFMLSVPTARKENKKKHIKLHLAVGFSYTDLHFYSMDFRDRKTRPLNAFQTFYTYVYFDSSFIFIYIELNMFAN